MAARLAQLRAAFLSLNAEQREALHLVAIEGLGPSATAEVLGVPTGTVMSRVGRARGAPSVRGWSDRCRDRKTLQGRGRTR